MAWKAPIQDVSRLISRWLLGARDRHTGAEPPRKRRVAPGSGLAGTEESAEPSPEPTVMEVPAEVIEVPAGELCLVPNDLASAVRCVTQL